MSTKTVRFAVGPDELQRCEFVGHLSIPSGDSNGILQVLVHGNSYDHRYWNAGVINNDDYSYVNFMLNRGYSVLAVDLPGTGDSDRPPTDAVGFAETGVALSMAIAQLRSTLEPGVTVALVGHSLGTILSVYTQAWWPAADLLVGTGVGFGSSSLPSPYGPGVREKILSDPYPRLPAQLRESVFYHGPGADPEVVAYDTRVLSTSLPRKIWADSVEVRNDTQRAGIARIACPVLIQLGEFDPVLPGCYAESERALWPAAADVTIEQVDSVGHCLNLHLARQKSWESIDHFLRTRR